MRNIFAAALALLGLAALAAPAGAQMVNAQTGSTYTFLNSDCDPQGSKLVTFNNSSLSAVAATLPAPGGSTTGQFTNCRITVLNLGPLGVTITPASGTIDGAPAVIVPPGPLGLTLMTDGTLWHRFNYNGTVGGANILDNGDFAIDQQYAGTGVALATGTPARSVDRWWGTFTTSTSSAGNPTPTQANISTGSTVQAKELKITMNSTPSTTQPAALIGYVSQAVEGATVDDNQSGVAGGIAGGSFFTYSLWMKTSVAGTFGIALQNGSQGRSYVSNCTTTAATWTWCSATIPADLFGNWLRTPNSLGMNFAITWTCGSTFQAPTANTWNAGNYVCTSAQTLLSATASATMELTNVKLERGSNATPFVPDSLAVAMQKARHWYVTDFKPGTAVAQNAGTGTGETLNYQQIASADPSFFVPFNPPIYHVASPTVTTYSPAAATAQCYDETSAAALAATPNTTVSDNGIAISCNTTQATIAHVIGIHWTVDTGY